MKLLNKIAAVYPMRLDNHPAYKVTSKKFPMPIKIPIYACLFGIRLDTVYYIRTEIIDIDSNEPKVDAYLHYKMERAATEELKSQFPDDESVISTININSEPFTISKPDHIYQITITLCDKSKKPLDSKITYFSTESEK
ncbi:hypothetical protein [Pediococcus parvulus]|uniref:hypothetical protein n=1 Tax=Pediococcus parvulus TaxID=54062 RepID=UPI0037571288